MRDTKVAILEDQVDTLAGRIAEVEEQYRRLIRVLTTDPTQGKLGLDAQTLELRCGVIKGETGERWRHQQARRDQEKQAEVDAFRRRIATAESLAELTHQSFPEAWDATRGDDDVEPGARATPSPLDTIWDRALAHLETVVNRYSFLTWFHETSLVRDEGATLVVRAADRLTASWLTTRYADVVAAALSAVGRAETSVMFVAEDVPRV
jgi:hypothetical protein